MLYYLKNNIEYILQEINVINEQVSIKTKIKICLKKPNKTIK